MVRNVWRAWLFAALAAGTAAPAWAEADTDGGGNFNAPLSATARLDFQVNMGKFIFFRLGSGAYPTADPTFNTATFGLVVPPGAVTPAAGNNTAVVWDGTLPTYNSTSFPVELRSNAGQVSLRANVLLPLTSGANTIPLSQVVVTSSDPNFPAPAIPNNGTGAAVLVPGTSFGNLVTERAATWNFAFSPATPPAAGIYNGRISFTASSP